ncbi:MAG: HDOD domain-containing protein [Actinomycetota bacterium]
MTQLQSHEVLLDLAEAITPLPQTVRELAIAIADRDVPIQVVADIVVTDPGLTAGLLSEANSAAAAPVAPVDTVEVAVVQLGMARTLALATLGALGDLPDEAYRSYETTAAAAVDHGIVASRAAEVIAALSTEAVGPEVITAALLHDLGMVVLGQVLDASQLRRAAAELPDLSAAERELVDADHAEVGALLLDLWRLPSSITEPIRYHHRPFDHPTPATLVVSLANLVATIVSPNGVDGHLDAGPGGRGRGDGPEPCVPAVGHEVARRLGVGIQEVVDRLIEDLRASDLGHLLRPAEELAGPFGSASDDFSTDATGNRCEEATDVR